MAIQDDLNHDPAPYLCGLPVKTRKTEFLNAVCSTANCSVHCADDAETRSSGTVVFIAIGPVVSGIAAIYALSSLLIGMRWSLPAVQLMRVVPLLAVVWCVVAWLAFRSLSQDGPVLPIYRLAPYPAGYCCAVDTATTPLPD